MTYLVVTTHPLNDSLCAVLTQHVVTLLTNAGCQLTVEDLYGETFSPVLTASERRSYYGENYDSSDIAAHVKKLQETETLILLFPTWWFGFPAMLKGWFDRVWGPGIAYDHASDFGPIQPRLNRLRNVLVITTLGAPWWVDRLVMRQPLKKIVKLALLGACAKNSKLKYLSLYSSETLNEHKINAFKYKIEKTLSKWT